MHAYELFMKPSCQLMSIIEYGCNVRESYNHVLNVAFSKCCFQTRHVICIYMHTYIHKHIHIHILISIAILIYSALNSMTGENLLDPNYQFETTLFAVLVSSIIVVQICWIIISCFYSSDIFSMCKHWNPSLRFGFRIITILFGPLMPAFVLANHVYYSEQSYSLTRDLQTLGKQKYDILFAMSHVMATDRTLDDMEDPVEILENKGSIERAKPRFGTTSPSVFIRIRW